MTALLTRAAETGKAQDNAQRAGSVAAGEWAQLRAEAPQAVATIHRYLRQLGTFLAPASVNAAENAPRQFARWLVTEAQIRAIADAGRDDIEDYKVWLAGKHRSAGQVISRETHRQRMRTVRQFFERIIEWDWPDAPARNPVIAGDIPKKPEPLPKFLDDRDYVPLHPDLVTLLAAWTAANLEHIRRCKRLVADYRGVLDRHVLGRIVRRVAAAAGVPGVHPHRLRHTLATQAINRGMRLEAIAALLGHYVGDRCQVDHGWFRYRRAAAAGERLSSRPVSAQVWPWPRAA